MSSGARPAPTRSAPPELSVVLATDDYETIRPVLERLRAQTIRDRLEIILVASEPRAIEGRAAELADFADVRVVEVAGGTPLACARAAGIRSAAASRIFVGETHSYPHPGMASALLEAHRQGWDVAVPAFGNANPEGLLSWTAFIADYGPDHLNLSRTSSVLGEKFLSGVLVGGTRIRRWGRPKRLLYSGASPLIAAVLAARAIQTLRQIRHRVRLPRWIVHGILGVSAIRAAGEALGYASGPRRWADEQMQEYELHKLHHVGFR
jgi:hypothetical protein